MEVSKRTLAIAIVTRFTTGRVMSMMTSLLTAPDNVVGTRRGSGERKRRSTVCWDEDGGRETTTRSERRPLGPHSAGSGPETNRRRRRGPSVADVAGTSCV